MKRSTDLILPDHKNAMSEMLTKNIDGVLSVLRDATNRQRFASAVIIAANSLKPNSCRPESVVLAALHAAMVGLVPGPGLRHCYFIPRKRNKGDARAHCQLEIGYQGYLHLVYGCRYLRGIYCDWVLRGEDFEHGMIDGRPTIRHKPPPDRDDTAATLRKSMIGAYVYWETVDGFSSHRYLTRKQIDVAEACGGPVWRSQWYGEMVLKTPIRRAAKTWNLTEPLSMALTLDAQLEAGEEQDLGAALLDVSDDKGPIDLDELDGKPEANDEQDTEE